MAGRMGEVTVLLGDARALTMPDESVDAIVCDPPYELGFMGRKWDASGVAYDVDMWRGCLRVLKPGAHLLAFGGTRTSHRMVTAIEDAGFEIRDSIVWLYGSGFPKSLDVSKAIDKAAGMPRWPEPDTEAVSTPEAQQWIGWGTALKPAHEPIVVARKPLRGTVADNVLAHGTGALNVDGCRVGTTREVPASHSRTASAIGATGISGKRLPSELDPNIGRWPSNVVLSHLSDEDGGDACASGCVDGCPVAELDGQSGPLTSGANPTLRNSDKFRNAYGDFTGQTECTPARGADTGGASRFFPTFRYQAKAPTKERPKVDGIQHPTVKPLTLMRWLVRLVTPPGGIVLDPFAGSGTTVEAAILEGFDVIAVEAHEPHLPLIQARERKPHQLALDIAWR